MKPINAFLLRHDLRIARNPCISPDFCLDWPALAAQLAAGAPLKLWPKSRVATAAGEWMLLEDEATGDCAWQLQPHPAVPAVGVLDQGLVLDGSHVVFPATWENLLRLKNLVQEHDSGSTIFPTAGARLGRSTIGVGARFTTLHWPAVEWTMSALELGVTANQNSIPRELVYDVDAMLAGRLDRVPFPFIGTDVPEGHQGQSVEGMSHGAVLSKLKSGFHHRRIEWSFNADHQPIGGKYDDREDGLVRGCLLASYITFDLSPELAQHEPASFAEIPTKIVAQVRDRVQSALANADGGAPPSARPALADSALEQLLCSVWPALQKMKRRDEKYRAARAAAFTTAVGRRYLRELSIDELPGLTTPATTAVMLALCGALDLSVNFIAPAFGFQKNTPYPDNAALRELVARQWAVCERFGVSIGFHSGSGKSADNYRVLGEVTGGALEIKTSGRYTYEMGVALAASRDPSDQALWLDWYRFTLELALAGAFSADPTEQQAARTFITTSLASPGCSPARERRDPPAPPGAGHANPFSSPAACRAALEALPPSAGHMFFFEYNFLYVLAAGGRPEKSALGDHTPAGYAQRARFYALSPEARLNYARHVARYLIFLAESAGLVPASRCTAARSLLERYQTYDEFFNAISR